MPKLKDGHISPTAAEAAKINEGIALDPDTPELDDDFFKNAKPIWEVFSPEVCEDLLALEKKHVGHLAEDAALV
jgi:hypothetical protein